LVSPRGKPDVLCDSKIYFLVVLVPIYSSLLTEGEQPKMFPISSMTILEQLSVFPLLPIRAGVPILPAFGLPHSGCISRRSKIVQHERLLPTR
jgi:hypothetical protein